MHHEAAFILLILIAAAVAIGAKVLRIPYTVALVVVGVLLSGVHLFEPPHLTQELLYTIFLPGLLFEAAFHLDARLFARNVRTILTLAIPGVAIAAGLTGVLVPRLLNGLVDVPLTLVGGLLFGTLIAATDPIAVVSLFKSLGAPKRLGVLVEGESLLNDGTAVVLFTMMLALAGGQAMTASEGFVRFLTVAGMGAVAGLVVGYAASLLTQRIEDPLVEITLTTAAAYGAFLLAESLHVSGVMATVTAGMVYGNFGAVTGMSPSTRLAVESFWSYVAFALNSLVFLLIGFEIHPEQLAAEALPILFAFALVLVARAVVVAGSTLLLRRTTERLPWSWTVILTWGGLRGGLSMVLALALPVAMAGREQLVTLTFGVVALSILLQGLTMAPLLRRLGLAGLRAEQVRHDLARGRWHASQAALAALGRLERQHPIHPEVIVGMRETYNEAAKRAEADLDVLFVEAAGIRAEEERAARRQVIIAQRDRLRHAWHAGEIGDEAHRTLAAELDAELLALDHQIGH